MEQSSSEGIMRQHMWKSASERAAVGSGWKYELAILGAAAAMLLLGTAPLPAQIAAPTATATVAPAATIVLRDTIYALAIDTNAVPRDLAKYPYIMLLDEGVSRFEADGRSKRTFRQVAEVLKPTAVAGFAERSFSFNPDVESLTINWIRVVKPSGEVISEKPTMSQESDIPASMGTPVYTTQKVRRYSLTGVGDGTLVDISWTIEEKTPYLKGNFYEGWNVSMGVPVRRSHFLLDMPASVTPRMVEEHLDFQKQVTNVADRRVYVWTRQEVTPSKGELFAPDSSAHFMSLRLSAPIAWSDIGRWYDGLARSRYVLGPAATSKVDSVVRSSKTRSDTLRALHHWIAHDLRYVAIALGIGGYQPRFPDSTVATGFGDCKDKATLFVAAARHLGITAYPVLLNAGGVRDTTLPAIEQFNHAIAAIPQAGTPSGYLFTDLTTDAIPPMAAPPPYQGHLLLVVLADGSSAQVVIPKDLALGNADSRITAELAPDGKISGHYVLSQRGAAGFAFDALARQTVDSARRASLARTFATLLFNRAKGDSLSLPKPTGDPDDTTRVATLSMRFRDGEGAKPAGALMLLSIPAEFRRQAVSFTGILDRLEDPENVDAKEPRRYPIDIARIFPATPNTIEMTVRLPEGWKAQLPRNVDVTSEFGAYSSEYTQHERDLTVRHRIAGKTGVVPKERYPALLAWMKTITADKVEYIVIEPSR